MKRDARLYIEDIIEAIDTIAEYTRGVTQEHFEGSKLLQDAVVRRTEIIGEAARQMPREVRERHPRIPWRKMAAMRNRVTHEYFGVVVERIWHVAQRDLPELKPQMQAVRASFQSDERTVP